jgi:hypothetical protein
MNHLITSREVAAMLVAAARRIADRQAQRQEKKDEQ